ncbi:hypothetical protein BDB00DRAFT_813948 [Zychaea mexicana]|uniref:uncharacterized protein n=1 Tax=Zychaea mexicana TaxID=64656 RepID=UPI0022FEA676|nr:uncharacterized protein BDB00DRAFT_813948 [Zychaea mexicana]KAI9495279.1 hypothetical protein BDB00DRAFT_813948 [Zychaea mexicana]
MSQHHRRNNSDSSNKSPALEALYNDLDAFIHELSGDDQKVEAFTLNDAPKNATKQNGNEVNIICFMEQKKRLEICVVDK